MVLVAMAASGCSGELMWGAPGSTGSPGDGSQEPVAPAGMQPDPIAPTGPTPEQCAAPRDIGTVTLHRLNRREYNNTVRDLLGDTSKPANDFPVDVSAALFDNNAAGLTLPQLLIEKYDAAAEKLAATAMTAGSATRSAIMVCAPTTATHDACQKQILQSFARRAFRRPVPDDEALRLVQVAKGAESRGDTFEAGIQLAVQAALLSPHFLFRVELDADPASTAVHPVSDVELASRLSYFLWSSMPDAALLTAAQQGILSTPAELDRQVQRMLNDPKAASLFESYFAQWLSVSALEAAAPDAAAFPSFDATLKSAMVEELRQTFTDLMANQPSVDTLLGSDHLFVNERLARHYGISGVSGSGFVRVASSGTRRGSLLTNGGILTLTSKSNRTSPTRRGAYVLAGILCTPPPPPPPAVPELDDSVVAASTVREQLEEHRKNPQCAGCHNAMDPLGLGMDNFDGIGQYRTTENGHPVDATGKLPSGESFDGAVELSQVLTNDPRFFSCVSRQLFSYSMGREATVDDRLALACDAQLPRTLPGMIQSMVHTDAFRLRRGGPAKL